MQTYLAPKKRLIPLLVVCTIFLLVIPLALFLSPSHLLLVFDIFIPIIIVVFHAMWHCVPTNGRQMFLLNKLLISLTSVILLPRLPFVLKAATLSLD